MPRIRNLFFKSLRVSVVGVGAIVAGALFLGVVAAQAPTSAPTNQATGDAALNGASLDYFPRDHLFRILGKEVLSAKGEDMGRIVDVLFDEKGRATRRGDRLRRVPWDGNPKNRDQLERAAL